MAYRKIKDLEELKKLASPEALECFISLAGGAVRSSKNIAYCPQDDTFDVFNEIDGSWEESLSEKDLWNLTNIGEALDKGALWSYGFESEGE